MYDDGTTNVADLRDRLATAEALALTNGAEVERYRGLANEAANAALTNGEALDRAEAELKAVEGGLGNDIAPDGSRMRHPTLIGGRRRQERIPRRLPGRDDAIAEGSRSGWLVMRKSSVRRAVKSKAMTR